VRSIFRGSEQRTVVSQAVVGGIASFGSNLLIIFPDQTVKFEMNTGTCAAKSK